MEVELSGGGFKRHSEVCYLNFLHGRVKCYLKRLRDVNTWQDYTEVSHLDSLKVVNEVDLFGSQIESQSLEYSNTRTRVNLEKNRNLFRKCNNSKYIQSKTQTGSDLHQDTPKLDETVLKELVIKTPHVIEKLKLKSLTANATKYESSNSLVLSRIKPANSNDINKTYPVKPNYKFVTVSDNAGVYIIKDTQVQRFQVPSTITFLESFLWDELLIDTSKELERITLDNSWIQKEQAMHTTRKILSNLQSMDVSTQDAEGQPANQMLDEENSSITQVTGSEKYNFENTFEVMQAEVDVPCSEVEKTSPVTLKMTKESVISILLAKSAFQNHYQKTWPPVLGIEDFHHATTQVSDALLEEALDHIFQELEQISHHIIQCTFAQEDMDTGGSV